MRPVAGVTGIAALCAVLGVKHGSTTRSLSGLLSKKHPSLHDSSGYRVVVVAQRADCSGNLSHLAFLDKDSIRSHVSERNLLVAGASRDTVGLRALLPRSLRHASIALLQPEQRELLAQIGHNETPVLAIYDSRDRLLIASATPTDALQRTAFVRAVARILTNNPAP